MVSKVPHNPFDLTTCIYKKLLSCTYIVFDSILNNIIIYRYAATTPRLQIPIELRIL